jgi:hypothetical protein
MDLDRAIEESDALAEELIRLVDLPLCNDAGRVGHCSEQFSP